MLERFLKYSYIIMICFLIGEECSKLLYHFEVESIPINILRLSIYVTLLCFLIDKSNVTVYSVVNDSNEIEGTFSNIEDALYLLEFLDDEWPWPTRTIVSHKLYNNNEWKEIIKNGDFQDLRGETVYKNYEEKEK